MLYEGFVKSMVKVFSYYFKIYVNIGYKQDTFASVLFFCKLLIFVFNSFFYNFIS